MGSKQCLDGGPSLSSMKECGEEMKMEKVVLKGTSLIPPIYEIQLQTWTKKQTYFAHSDNIQKQLE